MTFDDGEIEAIAAAIARHLAQHHTPPRGALPVASEWLDTESAAAVCGRSPYTIRAWIRGGRLRASKPNGRSSPWAIRRSDLDAAVAGDTRTRSPAGHAATIEEQAARALRKLMR